MPNKENIRKWVEALRSGKFKQGRKFLKQLNEETYYCCLGVACELAGVKGETRKFGALLITYTCFGGETACMLPSEVQVWLGVESPDPQVQGRTLSDWNDVAKKNFNEIADMIEKEWL